MDITIETCVCGCLLLFVTLSLGEQNCKRQMSCELSGTQM